MSNTRELYNNEYKKFTPYFFENKPIAAVDNYLDENSESLKNFLKQYFAQFNLESRLKTSSCLELGSGLGGLSLYLAKTFQHFLGLDISELAVLSAKEIARIKKSEINYKQFDVCAGRSINEKYDFIIDSHLLHCLSSAKERHNYLTFVKEHLTKEGVFLVETMVFQPKMQVPVGYYYEASGELIRDLKGELVPVRCLKSSVQIENELKGAGFKINYLYYHDELSINPFVEYTNHPHDLLPKIVRLSASL